MNYTYPTYQAAQSFSLGTEQSRQRLVAAVISSAQGNMQFTEPHEQYLLDQYLRKRLTIDEVVYFLEAKVKVS